MERPSSLRVRKAREARVAASSEAVEFRRRTWQLRLPAHFVIHAGFLQTPNAQLTPAGDCHVVDEGLFKGSLRLKFLVQSGEERKKAIRGFVFQNDRAGEHAMSHGIAGRRELARRSDGAAGFGAVGTGCLLLTFGAHATKRARGIGVADEFGRVLLIRNRL